MPFHDEVWGQQQGTRFIVAIRNGVVKHLPVANSDEVEETAQGLDATGWDVYFAPSQFSGQTRKADDVVAVPGLWLDLDAGEGKLHANAHKALDALLDWLTRRHLPAPTHIVKSGHGLHCYWLFDAAVPLDEWRPVARQFKRALAADKVADDLGCTTDAARILRLPGTHNHKHGQATPVELLHSTDVRVRMENISNRLPALGPQRLAPAPDDEFAVRTELPPGDAHKIAEGCAHIAHLRETRGAMPEPHWRAGLSVVFRCEGGDDLIHLWSQGDVRYSAVQTETKAKATAGPATCEHFRDLDPDRCKGCPWAGKITSPIQISMAAPEPIETTPEEKWRVSKVGQFVITSGGVWQNRDDDKPKRVTLVPLWVVEVRERAKRDSYEADEASLLLEWVGVDGRTKRAVVPQRIMYASEQQLKGWAAAENLASAVVDWKGLVMYISQYTLDQIKNRGTKRYHETLGWFQDGFVLGDRMVTAAGVQPAMVQSTNPIGRLKPGPGSVASWVEAVSTLNAEQFRAHQFTIQAGFGSALLEICGLQSAVVSLVGPPGTGKTMSANMALSIYGNPEYLRQGAKSSPKAMEKQLDANRNVPYLIDEITQWSAAQAGAICYMAANGQGDSKLTASRDNFSVGRWSLVPFVTSNRPLLDYPQTQFTEAHRARLVELYVGSPMARSVGAALAHASERDDFGLVGVPFLEWVCQNRDSIDPLIQDAIKQITTNHHLPESHRFAIWTLAAALVGGVIAQALGLIPWDAHAAVRYAADEVGLAASQVIDADDMAVDLVSEWLTAANDRIVWWENNAAVKMSMERDPVARAMADTETIALHRRMVSDLLTENGVSRRAAKKLFSGENLVSERRLALAPGTAPVWVYEVRWEAVGFKP